MSHDPAFADRLQRAIDGWPPTREHDLQELTVLARDCRRLRVAGPGEVARARMAARFQACVAGKPPSSAARPLAFSQRFAAGALLLLLAGSGASAATGETPWQLAENAAGIAANVVANLVPGNEPAGRAFPGPSPTPSPSPSPDPPVTPAPPATPSPTPDAVTVAPTATPAAAIGIAPPPPGPSGGSAQPSVAPGPPPEPSSTPPIATQTPQPGSAPAPTRTSLPEPSPAPAGSTTPGPPSPTHTPTPPGPAKTPPSPPPSPTASVAVFQVREAGGVRLRRQGDLLAVTDTTEAPGWNATVLQRNGRHVEVEFRRPGKRYLFNAIVENDEIVTLVRETLP